MKRKKHPKIKAFLIILLFVVLFFKFCGHKIETEPDPDKAPTLEWRTKTGQLCRVYQSIPDDYRSAIIKTIETVVPDADTSALNSRDGWIFSKFDDGMTAATFPMIKVNGFEYGGYIMLKFKDDGHDDYTVPYLKIGPELYYDDGTYDSDEYTEMEN